MARKVRALQIAGRIPVVGGIPVAGRQFGEDRNGCACWLIKKRN